MRILVACYHIDLESAHVGFWKRGGSNRNLSRGTGGVPYGEKSAREAYRRGAARY